MKGAFAVAGPGVDDLGLRGNQDEMRDSAHLIRGGQAYAPGLQFIPLIAIGFFLLYNLEPRALRIKAHTDESQFVSILSCDLVSFRNRFHARTAAKTPEIHKDELSSGFRLMKELSFRIVNIPKN